MVCTDIYNRHGAILANTVVEEASDKDHPLHSSFVWDNSKAGHLYRLEQANRMIRTVKIASVTSTGQCVQVRSFVNIPSERRETTYMPISVVKADDRLKSELVNQYVKDLRAYAQRLAGILDDVDAQSRSRTLFEEIEGLIQSSQVASF